MDREGVESPQESLIRGHGLVCLTTVTGDEVSSDSMVREVASDRRGVEACDAVINHDETTSTPDATHRREGRVSGVKKIGHDQNVITDVTVAADVPAQCVSGTHGSVGSSHVAQLASNSIATFWAPARL